MEETPDALNDASDISRKQVSKGKLLRCALIGLIAGPVILIAIDRVDFAGVLVSALIPLFFGMTIGSRTEHGSHVFLYCGIFGLTGALSLLILGIVNYDPADDSSGLTRYLTFFYSFIAGAVLFAIATVVSFIAHLKR